MDLIHVVFVDVNAVNVQIIAKMYIFIEKLNIIINYYLI